MKRLLLFSRIAITLFLIVLVLIKAGVFNKQERDILFQLVSTIDKTYFFYSLFISLLLNLSSSYKWLLLLLSRNIKTSFIYCYALYMIGVFYSLLLPTSMGGDVVRIHVLGKETNKKAQVAASVVVERFTGMVVLFLLASVALIFQNGLLTVSWLSISVFIALLSSFVFIWLIVDDRLYKLSRKTVTKKLPILESVFTKLEKIQYSINDYRNDPRAILYAFINSFIFYFLAVINVWVTALAFNTEVVFTDLLVAVPLILFIANIPLSIGGIGLMEYSYIFVFDIFGYSTALAISVAMLMRFKSLIDGSLGGVFYLCFTRNIKIEINE